jgi:hypothetical protein
MLLRNTKMWFSGLLPYLYYFTEKYSNHQVRAEPRSKQKWTHCTGTASKDNPVPKL